MSLNVRDFGARGDGVTNDTAAFQQAAAAAYRQRLLVPAGHYLIGETVSLPGEIVIEGDGKTATVIECVASVPTVALQAWDVSRVHLRDLAVHIQGGGIGVEFYRCNESQAFSCAFRSTGGVPGVGLRVRSSSSGYSNTWTGCDFEGCRQAVWLGLASDSDPGANVQDFFGCKWSTNAIGLYVERATKVGLFGGRFETHAQFGIYNAGPVAGLAAVNVYFESNGWHFQLNGDASESMFAACIYAGGRADIGPNPTNYFIGTFINEHGPVPGYLLRGGRAYIKGATGQISGVMV